VGVRPESAASGPAVFVLAAAPASGFTVSDFVVTGIVVAAAALALAGALWGLAEYQTTLHLRRALRHAHAKSRALVAARDAWLCAEREALLVWGPEMTEPLSFGKGAELMQACLSGPDATPLSAALDALTGTGTPFSMPCATPDGQRMSVRGQPTGGYLTVFLDSDVAESTNEVSSRAALEALPVPAWIRGKDLALTFVNRAFLAATGAEPHAALVENVAIDLSERELASTARAENKAIEAKRYVTLSGRRRAVAFTLTPLPEGTVVGTALDVTEATEAESRVQQHSEAQAEILDRLTTAVVIFGPDRRVSFFNHAFVALWGLSEAWLESRPLHADVLDRLRELRRLPEQPDFRAWKQQRLKMFERRDNYPEELWHLPTGQTLQVKAQPHPFGGVFILFEDVSNQLRLEMSYNQLIKVQKATLDTLHEGVAVFSPDGKLKLHNAAFARIWGFEASDLGGEPHLKRLAESSSARFGGGRLWDAVAQSVTSAASERNREWGEVERSDGTIVALTIEPLPDGATLASFADATDRFRIESALRERNEALEASDNLKSEFVKRMSYELRTPLNSILGFAEMVKAGMAGPLNDRQTEYIDAIVSASNGLRDLVNDILDLSQVEAGAMELDLEKVDIYLLLFGIAEHAREWAAKIGLTLTLDCAADAGQFIADARRLKQVVFSLLSNAFKFTPQGGTVTLSGDIRDEDVRICVEDTGPGLSPEFMPSAFERFSAKGTPAARPGAGLGLALVNRFVELHDGWVELESPPGGGTRVTCHLPRSLTRQKPRKANNQASV
jgi:signal transduction histidine kinase